MKLDNFAPYDWARALRGAADETVTAPLWHFPPEAARAVLSERRRRFGVPTSDDFDPLYH